jgi:hypothetical protein
MSDAKRSARNRIRLTRVAGWVTRLDRFWRWLAGVAAAVVVAVVTAWLVAWGLVPDGRTDAVDAGQVPFTVAVDVQHQAFIGWLSPKPLPQVPARPAWDGDWSAWADRAEILPVSTLSVHFTVQGKSAAQVTLTDLRVRVTERRPALKGTVFNTAGGDPTAYRWIAADLDADPPKLQADTVDFLVETVPEPERRPIRFPYEVSISDAETFVVDGRTVDCHCFWEIELSWASQGQVGKLVIDDAGHPFEVTGTRNVTQTCSTGSDTGERCRPGS